MCKTLEELGYKKILDSEDLLMYKIRGKMITFSLLTKDVAFAAFIESDPIITMEELKAIYKYCEDNKWI